MLTLGALGICIPLVGLLFALLFKTGWDGMSIALGMVFMGALWMCMCFAIILLGVIRNMKDRYNNKR